MMITIIKKFLNQNFFGHLTNDFEDIFLSHPNYPSVYAITDTLDVLSIENVALKIPKEQFSELPEQFLTFYKEDLVLLSKLNSSVVIEGKDKKQSIGINDFLTDWNGVVIAVEANESEHVHKKNGFDFKWMMYSLPLLMLIVISVFRNSYSLESLVFLLTSIVGFVVSIFIVQENLGVKNEAVSKLCNINPNTSCDSVIKSDKSKINKWIGFSDLPLIFFGVSVLSMSFQPDEIAKIVGMVSLVSFPLIVYSVWIQKAQLKKWCVLCLAVSFVVVMQGLFYFANNFTDLKFEIDAFFAYFFFAVLFASLWLFVKPVFENKIKAEEEVNKLKKFKRNYTLFKFLSKDIPVSEGFEKLEGLQFGIKEAVVKLTIILSPSCGHCHKAFQDAFELYSKFPEKIHLNVLFNINPKNDDNPYKIIIESLLTINNNHPEEAKKAIMDWHIKKMELEEWKEKWEVERVDMKANNQIHQQYSWCLENQFNYTPVKIINGRLFPNEYDINELKYFFNNFLEEVQKEESEILIHI
jgi:uncharacterized membrane protein